MKVKLEYVWLDGYTPEPNLRSKVKIVDYESSVKFPTLADCPEWGFDGSSTMQAEGHFSDCVLKPVRVYGNPMNKGKLDSYLVLCEVTNPDGTPHETNTRSLIGEEDYGLWFGFEQEYTIVKDGKPLGFPINGYPEPQGKYYCGVGNGQVNGREFVEKHMENCLLAGIGITGTNAEVMLGQWEYQVFGKGKLKASDDLWVSRYMLMQMSEDYGFKIEFHPKPVIGDWNGSGLHCNFSTERMRNEGGRKYFNKIFNAFGFRHEIHIQNYGSDNHLRLTGRHETQSINKFSWGVSDRGASIRVPLQTSKNWMGYLEDRRPASNADPYKIVNVISETLNFATELGLIEYNTEYSKNVEDLIRKFSGVTSEDLLKEYYNDEKYELTGELMESKANIDSEEIEFNINFK
jgi:glutamine synthetase